MSLDSNKAIPKLSLCNKARLKLLHFCHITNSRARNNRPSNLLYKLLQTFKFLINQVN